jgi:glyoxylase-like metal-dependent hydrolase (beta-lactamase superfamily II)
MKIQSVTDYEAGVSAIDTGYIRPMFDAVHLIVENARAALVDTGTSRSLPRVLDALQQKGLSAEQVDWVMLTHVHLDHAGGAGTMMQAFANAKLAVHPRGARHMADPARLVEGTMAVYGEQATRRLYGDILPIDKERIVEMPQGARAQLAGREFVFLDTPGHARHHLCILDSKTGHVFTGDTFGLSYRELDDGDRQFIFPSTTPVQFDPAALHDSIDLIMSYRPEAIYVTHYGQLRDLARLAHDMHRLVDAHAGLALKHRHAAPRRHAVLKEGVEQILLDERKRYGWKLTEEAVLQVLGADVELNVQGLEAWLDAMK